MTSGGFHDFDWEARALRKQHQPRSLWDRFGIQASWIALVAVVALGLAQLT